MSRWADYSAGRPSGAALRAAGFVGVIRYVGIGRLGKRITAAEYRDLVAEGLQVALVAELGVDDAWGTSSDDDYARGVRNGILARSDAAMLGIPPSVPIACAADAHAANQQQIGDAVRYATGFEDAVGQGRAGYYGFNETLNAVHAAGVGSWWWRCGSEPTAAEKQWVTFWQRNTTPAVINVQGVPCDVNEQYNPLGDNDMALTDDERRLLAEVHLALYGSFETIQGLEPRDGKLAVWEQVTDIQAKVAALAAGPVPDIDYDRLAAAVVARLGALEFKAVTDAE